jgi:hypothetical protein
LKSSPEQAEIDALQTSDHLLKGLLFDDAGHRMIATHATKAGVRHRYSVSKLHIATGKLLPKKSIVIMPISAVIAYRRAIDHQQSVPDGRTYNPRNKLKGHERP